MNSATKVGEIFSAAGMAFTKLGELTMQLHPPNDSAGGTKWTDEEIEMIHSCISKFGEELDQICERIKTRTVSQIRGALSKKAYEDLGLSLPSPPNSIVNTPGHSGITTPIKASSAIIQRDRGKTSIAPPSMKNSEVTLNMLNASDGDDANLSTRMDFETPSVTQC